MAELSDYSLISADTPLISNLNMIENIALIHEVHNHTPTNIAQEEAKEYLNKIKKLDIGLKRTHQCNEVEIFYIMIIRALMTSEKTIVILHPLAILQNIEFLAISMKNLSILNDNKNIIILENDINRFHYEGM